MAVWNRDWFEETNTEAGEDSGDMKKADYGAKGRGREGADEEEGIVARDCLLC
jgi:hypothetical protein